MPGRDEIVEAFALIGLGSLFHAVQHVRDLVRVPIRPPVRRRKREYITRRPGYQSQPTEPEAALQVLGSDASGFNEARRILRSDDPAWLLLAGEADEAASLIARLQSESQLLQADLKRALRGIDRIAEWADELQQRAGTRVENDVQAQSYFHGEDCLREAIRELAALETCDAEDVLPTCGRVADALGKAATIFVSLASRSNNLRPGPRRKGRR